MNEPEEQSKFVTCSCQNCSGHIRFDASQFRKGETRNVECPHCHMDTVIFVRDRQEDPPKTAKDALLREGHGLNERKGPATQFELFVLRLTRGLVLIGSALVLSALAVTAIVFVSTFVPKSKPRPAIISVSYDDIDYAIRPQSSPSVSAVSYGNRINTAATVPPLVANFVINHPGFKLDTSTMDAGRRKAFLSNLAAILKTASTKHLSDAELVKLVDAYVDLWTAENTPKPEPKPLFTKAEVRSFCTVLAARLFIAITVLCLILVLLAIERSIRQIAEKPASSGIKKESKPTTP